MENLKEGQLIFFDLKNGIKGTGKIRGFISSYPILGTQYIVEMLQVQGIDHETYPYSSLSVFENFIEENNEDVDVCIPDEQTEII